MIIIADSGSTKTEWVMVRSAQIIAKHETDGFNPVYFRPAALEKSLRIFLSSMPSDSVTKIFFYGAGCSGEQSKDIVSSTLKKHFPQAMIEVNHDLFGAARALFGKGSGIAAILGTGSSSCLIQNNVITHLVPSLGYLLADEGSGSHLGKLILNTYFKNELPPDLHQKFETEFKIDKSTFISNLYAHKKPNAFIASFTPFVVENQQNEVIQELIKKAFRIFFEEIITKYPNFKNQHLGFAGSVASLFQANLKSVAGEFDLEIKKIIKNPIDDLVNYHLKNG